MALPKQYDNMEYPIKITNCSAGSKCELLKKVFPDGKDYCNYDRDRKKMNDIYEEVIKTGNIKFDDLAFMMAFITKNQPSQKDIKKAYTIIGGYQPVDKINIESKDIEPPQGGTGEI